MKLIRLEVSQFKKLTAIDITFGDHVTEISGPNGAGKSSAIDAIAATLEGMSSAPKDPIHLGAEQCFVRSTLRGDDGAGLIVTRRFRRDPKGKVVSDLTLTTPEGARYPAPQEHLNKIISDHMLDPLLFTQMDDKAQFDALRAYVADFDFEAHDKACAAARERRTELGRDLKIAQGAAAAIDVSDTPPAERIDEAALTAELRAAGDFNLDLQRRRTNREQATERVAELRKKAANEAALVSANSDAAVQRVNQRVAELEAQIKALRDGLAAELVEIRTRHESAAAAATAEADSIQQRLDGADALPPAKDAAAIEAALTAARIGNKALDEWENARQQKQTHTAVAEKLSAEVEALTADLAELEQKKKAAIAKAHLPVDGLGFGEGFITLNGVRFSQASTAEKYRTAFAICVAKRPKLPLCWIRDASLLDDSSLAIVRKLAADFDCQVILETVRPTSDNAIQLVDGRVEQAEAAA